jgi:hypothetical protein
MRYLPLTDPKKVIDWARAVVTSLVQRDAEIDRQIKDIKDRLDAGGL